MKVQETSHPGPVLITIVPYSTAQPVENFAHPTNMPNSKHSGADTPGTSSTTTEQRPASRTMTDKAPSKLTAESGKEGTLKETTAKQATDTGRALSQPTTSGEVLSEAKEVQQPNTSGNKAAAPTKPNKNRQADDSQALVARIEELERLDKKDREDTWRNLNILQARVHRKFQDFGAELVKELRPTLAALAAHDASTAKKLEGVDSNLAQIDGRVVRVEEWMDRYTGEIADSMEARWLSEGTPEREVEEEPEATPALEAASSSGSTPRPRFSPAQEIVGELDRVAELGVASTSPKRLGLTEIGGALEVVATPKPFSTPCYDLEKRRTLAELIPYQTRNVLIKPLKIGEFRVRVVKNSRFDEPLMKKVEKQLVYILSVGGIATSDVAEHVHMLRNTLIFHQCWVQRKGHDEDFRNLQNELKAVTARLISDMETSLFKSCNWANEEKVCASHRDCANVHEAFQGQWAIESIFKRLDNPGTKDAIEAVRLADYYWAKFARSVEPLWQLVASMYAASSTAMALKARLEGEERDFQQHILQVCKEKGLHQSQ
jgi:hypothetical protein